MGGVVLSILVWQEGGESVLALMLVGPDLFSLPHFRLGISAQLALPRDDERDHQLPVLAGVIELRGVAADEAPGRPRTVVAQGHADGLRDRTVRVHPDQVADPPSGAGILPGKGRELAVAGADAWRARRLAAVVICAGLVLGGCGEAFKSSSDGGSSGGSSDVCDALARFENSFEAAVDAVASGDTNAKMGAASTLKQESVALLDALQTQKADLEPLTTAVRGLTSTVARLPHDATPQRVKAALEPHIQAVGDAIGETASGLGCPAD